LTAGRFSGEADSERILLEAFDLSAGFSR